MYPEIYTDDVCITRVGDSIVNPFSFSRLFFVDEKPAYNWGHSCSYIFIDTTNGNYQRIEDNFLPFGYKDNMEEISISHSETIMQIIPPVTPVVYNNDTDPLKYALMFSGDSTILRWNDLSHMYSALKRNGFSDDNIFVFKPSYTDTTYWQGDLDKDQIHPNDFDGDCTYENIENTLENLKETLNENDIFYFYCSTHGDTTDEAGNSSLILQNGENVLNDDELAAMVQDFNCSEMIFVIDACFSGGFVEELESNHRTIQTCTNGEMMMILNKKLGYNYLTYAYATALKGYHPVIGQPWTINLNAPIGSQDLTELCDSCFKDKEDINPDEIENSGNADGYYQTGEAFRYSAYLCGQIADEGENYQNHGFKEDLLALNGIEGRVDTTQNITGNYLIGRNLTLSPGIILSKGPTSLDLYLNNGTEILIQDSAKLDINGYSADIIGCSGESYIKVEGDLRHTMMDFTANQGARINISFNNMENEYELENFTFENAFIQSRCKSLSFTESSFENSMLDFTNGDYIISNSQQFANSTITLSNPGSTSSFCEIIDNSIDNNSSVESNAVITIQDYDNFLIENNEISYDANRGIELLYAGWDERGDHTIRKNTIKYNGTASPGNGELGIHSYYSNAEIENNRVSKNYFGLTGFHGSYLAVTGDSTAKDIYETQLIEDNTQSQCIFSYGSFPYEFQYNVLKDTLPANRPFIQAVEYDEMIQDTNQNRGLRGSLHFHVENNCWVNDTNPSNRLLPLNAYYWRDIWCPGSGHLESDDIPRTLYYQAINNIQEGNYQEAESGFKQIIAEYPENKYAQAALKGLFSLNPAIQDTNYTFVKAYCDSLSLNPGDSLLGKTAEWLSIHCNIRDKQYQQAINSLDSIIINPGTLEDSVFALIDLSYVFNAANDSSGLKVTLVTKHPEVIPESNMKYVMQRKE
jgi:hypothetical protein